MADRPWLPDPGFGRLCDLVASDRLVGLTGAGISSRLPLAADPSRAVPGWHGLLLDIAAAIGPRLGTDDRADCDALLSTADGTRPSGRHLILAASILRTVAPDEFDRAFRTAVTPVEGRFSDTHAALREIRPRGIVTFNYDNAHEAAAEAAGQSFDFRLLPYDEPEIARALSGGLARPFLLKAHGSLHSTQDLVLTQESYRHLLAKSPAYEGFFQHLLTNFHFLVVGFGLDDPDFDLFVDTVANQYGSPLQEHVVIRHQSDRGRNEVLLRRRYGFHMLYVADFGHIPEILRDAARTPGPRLAAAIASCLSERMEVRSQAHRELAALGPAGKALASASLTAMLDTLKARGDSFGLSEIAYTLGRIDARANREALLRIVDEAVHADPAGRALTVLREALVPADIPRLAAWRDRCQAAPLAGERADRILTYLEYLIVYVDSKFKSFKPAPGS